MMAKYSFLFLVLNIFVFCESGLVGNINKCHLTDEECGIKAIANVLKHITKGDADLGLPPIDPFEFKNKVITILEGEELHAIEGHIDGITSCVVNEKKVNLKKLQVSAKVTCNVITATSKYKGSSSNPAITGLLNVKQISGNGNGKAVLEKLKLALNMPFTFEKRDGKIYLQIKKDECKLDFDIEGNFVVSADNIMIGDVESSKAITDFINKNWRPLMKTFGKPIANVSLNCFLEYADNFFDKVSVTDMVLDDLSKYVK